MNVVVTMASGEVDEWSEVADAIDDRGSLIVLDHIDSDEVPGSMKVLEITREEPQEGRQFQGQDPPPVVKTTTYEVLCQYAPGMWIKVEYNQ